MDNSNNRIMKSCSKVPPGFKERKSDDQEYSFLLGYVTKLLLNTPFFKGIFTEVRQQRRISSHTFRQFPLKLDLENSLINCSTNCWPFTTLIVVCLPVRSVPPPPFTYRSLQLLGGCIDADVAVRVLASEPGLDDIKVNGVVELVGSLPAYRNRVLRMTRQIHNRRCTGAAHIGALGNLIGGFALVLCCECLNNDAVVGKGLCKTAEEG